MEEKKIKVELTISTPANAFKATAFSDETSRTPARVLTPFNAREFIVALPTLPVDPITRIGLVDDGIFEAVHPMVKKTVGGCGGQLALGSELDDWLTDLVLDSYTISVDIIKHE